MERRVSQALVLVVDMFLYVSSFWAVCFFDKNGGGGQKKEMVPREAKKEEKTPFSVKADCSGAKANACCCFDLSYSLYRQSTPKHEQKKNQTSLRRHHRIPCHFCEPTSSFFVHAVPHSVDASVFMARCPPLNWMPRPRPFSPSFSQYHTPFIVYPLVFYSHLAPYRLPEKPDPPSRLTA